MTQAKASGFSHVEIPGSDLLRRSLFSDGLVVTRVPRLQMGRIDLSMRGSRLPKHSWPEGMHLSTNSHTPCSSRASLG